MEVVQKWLKTLKETFYSDENLKIIGRWNNQTDRQVKKFLATAQNKSTYLG